jgi:hypothetical protein
MLNAQAGIRPGRNDQRDDERVRDATGRREPAQNRPAIARHTSRRFCTDDRRTAALRRLLLPPSSTGWSTCSPRSRGSTAARGRTPTTTGSTPTASGRAISKQDF